MTDDKFMYVIYIASTPQKMCKALRDDDAAIWGQGKRLGNWKAGSKWEHWRFDAARTIDLVGEVIASVPPRGLVLSWAEPADGPNRAKHTRVAIANQSRTW